MDIFQPFDIWISLMNLSLYHVVLLLCMKLLRGGKTFHISLENFRLAWLFFLDQTYYWIQIMHWMSIDWCFYPLVPDPTILHCWGPKISSASHSWIFYTFARISGHVALNPVCNKGSSWNWLNISYKLENIVWTTICAQVGVFFGGLVIAKDE